VQELGSWTEGEYLLKGDTLATLQHKKVEEQWKQGRPGSIHNLGNIKSGWGEGEGEGGGRGEGEGKGRGGKGGKGRGGKGGERGGGSGMGGEGRGRGKGKGEGEGERGEVGEGVGRGGRGGGGDARRPQLKRVEGVYLEGEEALVQANKLKGNSPSLEGSRPSIMIYWQFTVACMDSTA